jgi:hypothetical protein
MRPIGRLPPLRQREKGVSMSVPTNNNIPELDEGQDVVNGGPLANALSLHLKEYYGMKNVEDNNNIRSKEGQTNN